MPPMARAGPAVCLVLLAAIAASVFAQTQPAPPAEPPLPDPGPFIARTLEKLRSNDSLRNS
jgi:hypothetical protein